MAARNTNVGYIGSRDMQPYMWSITSCSTVERMLIFHNSYQSALDVIYSEYVEINEKVSTIHFNNFLL